MADKDPEMPSEHADRPDSGDSQVQESAVHDRVATQDAPPVSESVPEDTKSDGGHVVGGAETEATGPEVGKGKDSVTDLDIGQRALAKDYDGVEAPTRVTWKRDASGKVTVWVRFFDGDSKPYWSVECQLTPDEPKVSFPYPRGEADGTLELTQVGDDVELRGNLPLTPDRWFQNVITRWPRLQSGPAPDKQPGASRIEAPTEASHEATTDSGPSLESASVPASFELAPTTTDPAPLGPGPCPPAADGWRRGGTVIDNPENRLEILRCLWLRSADPYIAPATDPCLGLGWVLLANPDRLPLYVELEKKRLEPGGRDLMMEAAQGYFKEKRKDGYVHRISELETPVSEYGQLVSLIRSLDGIVPIQKILEETNLFLFAYGDGPLGRYLKSGDLVTVERRVWQTLFAVALGAWEDPALGDDLVEVLRMNHFLRELQRELTAPDKPLTTPLGRQAVLSAKVVLPEGAVPLAPGCDCDPPRSTKGWVKAVGIGDLVRIYECLLGYELGEVASVVNVMARERLELSARALSQHHTASTEQRTQTSEDDGATEEQSRSDLRQEVRDLIAAETLCSHYNNLTQDYDPPTITLNGSWSGNDCLKERADSQTRDYAQALTRRAASRIVDAVTRTRAHQHFEEHERSTSRDLDNRSGAERLTGIYRWLEKLYRLTLEDGGKRLIVEFEIADPGQGFLEHVRDEHGIRLEPPPTLPEQGVTGPADITPQNYLELASVYGIEAPEPPPPDPLVQVAGLQTQPPVSETEIAVPAGYQIETAVVALLLGDAAGTLAGYVGDAPFGIRPEAPTESLAVATGAASDSSECPPCEDPFTHSPTLPEPVVSFQSLDKLVGRTDTTLPFVAIPNISPFFASATVTCKPTDGGLLAAWQTRTYSGLVGAYDRSQALYLKRLRARIQAASGGRERQIERRELRRESIRILAAQRADPEPEPCPPPPADRTARYRNFFERAFDWPEITYAFHPRPPVEETCERDPLWLGLAVVDLEADTLFKSFLQAGSARVLVPVRPGAELEVLYYLLFGLLWPGLAEDTPVAAIDIGLVADLKTPPVRQPAATWRLRIPTSLCLLQRGEELPDFACPWSVEAPNMKGVEA